MLALDETRTELQNPLSTDNVNHLHLEELYIFNVAKVHWVHGAEAPGKPLAAASDKYFQTIEDNLMELLVDKSSIAHNDR